IILEVEPVILGWVTVVAVVARMRVECAGYERVRAFEVDLVWTEKTGVSMRLCSYEDDLPKSRIDANAHTFDVALVFRKVLQNAVEIFAGPFRAHTLRAII